MAKKHSALAKLGDNLRKAREEKGWSQEELAERAGVHRTYVGGVERAEYNVTVLTLLRFTGALGVSPSDVMRGIR